MHDAVIAGQKVFRVQGNQRQHFVWEECGFKLQVPQDTNSSLVVGVSALAGGHFTFPEGTELVSGVYAVVISAPILKDLIIELEHCLLLSNEDLIKYAAVAVASPVSSNTGYEFHLMSDQKFTLQKEYGCIHISKSSCYCILFKKDDFCYSMKKKQMANGENETEECQDGDGNGGKQSKNNESVDVKQKEGLGGKENQDDDNSDDNQSEEEGGRGNGGEGDGSTDEDTSSEEQNGESKSEDENSSEDEKTSEQTSKTGESSVITDESKKKNKGKELHKDMQEEKRELPTGHNSVVEDSKCDSVIKQGNTIIIYT